MTSCLNIEMFCGAGGMAEGFRRAGIEFDLAFDADPNACDSYEANLGRRPVQMDCRDLLRLLDAGWCPESVGLVVADPPCTPWSRAGKRKGLGDERDMLRETVALVRKLKPRVWLIGNIPGLDDSNNWGTVQDVIGGLTDIGYCIDYKKINAANHGVPQLRVRPFWLGHRAGTRCISWPAPTHGAPAALGSPDLGEDRKPWVTCREALGHLSEKEVGRQIRQKKNMKHPLARPEDPAFTITTNGGRHQSNCLEWPWDRPSTVVYAATDQIEGPGKGWKKKRANCVILSELAATILQGFPESWVFAGKTKAARWAQIGQAMPPALAQAVASSIVAGRYLEARENAA